MSGPGFTPDNEFIGQRTVLGVSTRRQHGLLYLSKSVPRDSFDSSPLGSAGLYVEMLGKWLEEGAVISLW